jgi:ribose-phosphate pyrophosphokinase
MELLITIRALRGASARVVNVIIPYLGYARQDKKVEPRTAISARLIADMIQLAGAHRVIMMDLHSNQIQGFFDVTKCPVDHLYAKPAMISHIKSEFKVDNLVILSPDAGGVDRARSYAKELNADFALAKKRREKANEIKEVQIIGDVKDKIILCLDDILDTFGTMEAIGLSLNEAGAQEIHSIGIHPVLSGPALEKITNSEIKSVTVTNTIPLSLEAEKCSKIKVVSVAEIFAKAIKRIYEERSVSALFIK